MLLGIALAGGIALYTQGSPALEAAGHEHCFAEWCIAPVLSTIEAQSVSVSVRVRSDAKQASQRPDHPQAWVIDASGRKIGGPQHVLDLLVAPGDSYIATITFRTPQPGTCPRLRVSEGGWPSFLGLGYAASPFTSQVEWRLCEISGGRDLAQQPQAHPPD
ncbi:MAG TPA: hypothetical protein VGF78_04580 [Candidatus Dormibacteraeota bacterium]